MEQPKLEQRVIEALKRDGVDFKITVKKPNILHKLKILRKEKSFIIFPICLGTLFRISRVLNDGNGVIDLSPQMTDGDFIKLAIKNVVENKDRMIQVVALAIRNNNKPVPRGLLRFLDKNLTAKEVLRLLTLVVQMMDTQDFLACMVSLGQMNLVTPRRTGGESSAELSSTSALDGTTSSGGTAGRT